jgi:uncharacterized protein (DUF983 family)
MTGVPLIAVPVKRSMALGMKRGASLRCPSCGEGRLYRAYLKVKACDVCGNNNAAYPSDDAPPYFTILIVGHLVIGPLLFFPIIWQAPAWIVLGATLPALLGLILLLLPVVKGAVVGAHWALEPRQSVEEP